MEDDLRMRYEVTSALKLTSHLLTLLTYQDAILPLAGYARPL
jgi:hypothetical protein